MISLLFQRTIELAAMLIAVSLFVFGALSLLPGDPAATMLGTSARPDTLAALRLELGLDKPFVQRWLEWLGSALAGDFGSSLTYGMPVAKLVLQRLAVTLPLASLALILAVTLAVTLGTAATGGGQAAKLIARLFGSLGVTLPNFWIGLLLILVFASTLGWFPAGGFPGWEASPFEAAKSLLLPAIALALPQAAVLTRVVEAALQETMREPFIRTALAKGMSRRAAISRHALRNALVPIVTVIGLQFSFLVAGAVLVENVFALPGLGQLAYQALTQRDFVTLQAVALLLTGSVVVVNAIVDVSYLLIDPRMRDAR